MPNPYEQGIPVRLVPCTVTTVTPLLVTILGQPGVSAVKINGATYTTGPANALLPQVGQPIVLPIA
jgi:hypothetical protein